MRADSSVGEPAPGKNPMPIRLTHREFRIIAAGVLVASVSLGIGVKYFWRAFPEAAIDFRLTREQSAPVARKFLADRGIRLEGYRHTSIFNYSDETKVYLERTQGLERMNGLTRGPVRLWRWSHRWFMPRQKEEFRVEVTPAGEVVGYDHEIEEAAPGAGLDPAAARGIAEKFLREVKKRDLSDLEFLETETEKRPARTDHLFAWKQRSLDLGEGSLRVEVEVDGDEVAGYREYVKIPEQWSRDYEKLRSRNDSAQVVAEVLLVMLSMAMLIILVRRLRDRDVPARLAAWFGLVTSLLYFLGQLNDFSVAEFTYRTTDSYSSFVAGYLQRSVLAALGAGAWVFFLVGSSEPVYRENFGKLISIRRYMSWKGLRTRSFFMAYVVGLALTFFFFAYQTIFYLAANKLGAWAPADVNYSDLLNTRIPWVWVLFGGFLPAVSEEMQFRAFAVPFLRKILRSGTAGLVLAAFIWGFLHSAYPNQPFYIRGVEVGLGGIIIGFVMLRFGILATLVWHYSVDAIYTAFLLLRSHNNYMIVSGCITAGIMLVPLAVALVAYWRTGTFEQDEALSNTSEGVSRLPTQEAAHEAEAPIAYQPLDARRLILAGILIAVFAGLAALPAYRFGKDIKVRTTGRDAERLADEFLAKRQVNAASYRRVAALHENLDPFALKYLLERKPVEECDRIYRQATRLLLWEVRYFRPLEKEEHLVFVDVAGGEVFAYRHLLDEDAPGASLSTVQARSLSEKFVERQGFVLSGFELEDSQAKKRKAREDYTFVWQAKSGDQRNVGEARFRLEVDVAGNQVVGLTRYFKLPEDWERRQSANTLPNQILNIAFRALLVLAAGLGILVLVRQIRSGKIPWRATAKVAAALAAMLLLGELNQLSTFSRGYRTEVPWKAFWLFGGAQILLVPLVQGFFGWLLVGLAVSLYPAALRIFRGPARRVWRRDAAVAVLVSVAAGAAITKLAAVVFNRFHAYAPVRIDLTPGLFDSYLPAAGLFLGALALCVILGSAGAVAIYLFRESWARRAWWLWPGSLLLLASLGPARAHSVPEFFVGWAGNAAMLVIALGIVAVFFRNNPLAYVAAAFFSSVAGPIESLLSQPAPFFRWNGVLLVLLALIVLGWMLAPMAERPKS